MECRSVQTRRQTRTARGAQVGGGERLSLRVTTLWQEATVGARDPLSVVGGFADLRYTGGVWYEKGMRPGPHMHVQAWLATLREGGDTALVSEWSAGGV